MPPTQHRPQPSVESSRIPAPSLAFWIVLLSLFVVALALTAWKDWWLTGEQPNVLFYLLVPAISMLCGVLCMLGVARLIRQLPTFLELLAIIVGVNTLMQAVEIVLKLVYYLVWKYPGWLKAIPNRAIRAIRIALSG